MMMFGDGKNSIGLNYHITLFWGWFLQDECPMVLIISHAKSHACAGAGDLCTGYAVKNGGKNKVIK